MSAEQGIQPTCCSGLPHSGFSLMGVGGGGLVPKSCLTLATPQTGAHQAPLPMGFPRQEHWSGWTLPSPGGLLDPGMDTCRLYLLYRQADSSPPRHMGNPKYVKNRRHHPYGRK